ncbi:MAG: hypothetical protein AB7K08_08300 [Microbacteriaceae bacterium]
MSDREPRHILVLVGADGDAPSGAVLESESTPLTTLLGDRDRTGVVAVLSAGTSRTFARADTHLRLDEDDRSVVDRVLGFFGAFALFARFDRFPVGRLLNSIGPVAPGRVFWRRVRRDPDAMAALHAADVVIASDLETTKAAWIAARRGWVEDAFYDHRAVAILDRDRQAPG